MKAALLLLAWWMAGVSVLGASPKAYGPYQAQVLRVVDGDTVEVSIEMWPGLTQVAHVRLLGINAPETHGKGVAPCEHAAGVQAKDYLASLMARAKVTQVTQVSPDKYGGRFLGRLLADGQDVSESMLKARMAVPYHGGKRSPWVCR
ncbi:MAG: thermonuclease family protein [Deltaproteobacteria bacterium]|nr:thermonuclease family protein [Deltaproteobacteria bacterium]